LVGLTPGYKITTVNEQKSRERAEFPIFTRGYKFFKIIFIIVKDLNFSLKRSVFD
jgi:hypothetical protein